MPPPVGGKPLDFFTMDDFPVAGKTVLVRVDINSPLDPVSGRLLNDNRIRQHITTLRELRDAKVAILAHQGRPGKDDFVTMEAHAERLSYYLGRDVDYVDSLFGKSAVEAIRGLQAGEFVLLENTRFYAEEILLRNADLQEMTSAHIITTLAPLADLFVNDAFAAAHRAQPSLVGFCEVIPCLAGRVLEREITTLEGAFGKRGGPRVAVLGGVKVEDSVAATRHLLTEERVDRILTTGAVANFFLWASGQQIGEPNEALLRREVPAFDAVLAEAEELLKRHRDRILTPVDLVMNVKGDRKAIEVEDLPAEHPIYDIGLDSIVRYLEEINAARVVLLNGAAGVFEIEPFSIGTRELFLGVAQSKAFKIVGGGHTVTAVEQLGIASQIDHISTGGGSLMYYLAGRSLPVLDALRRSKAKLTSPESTGEL